MLNKETDELLEELRSFREDNFYPSWNEISRELGISSKTLQRWRKGVNGVSKNTVKLVESFLENNDYDNSVKECNCCGELKPRDADNYYRDENSKDGFDGGCKACTSKNTADSRKKYYENNKEKILEDSRGWLKNNRKQRREWRRSHYQENIESMRVYQNEWFRDNPDKVRMYSQRRTARVNELPNTLTETEWEEVLYHFGHSCSYCGIHQDDLKTVLNQEHVIPVTKKGGYTADNIIPACKSCNSSKSNRDFEEWYSEHGSFTLERYEKIVRYISGK